MKIKKKKKKERKEIKEKKRETEPGKKMIERKKEKKRKERKKKPSVFDGASESEIDGVECVPERLRAHLRGGANGSRRQHFSTLFATSYLIIAVAIILPDF